MLAVPRYSEAISAQTHRRLTRTLWAGVAVGAVTAAVLGGRTMGAEPTSIVSMGYLAIFAAVAIGTVLIFLPVPVMAIVFIGATILNPFAVVLCVAAGVTAGMTCSYIIGTAGSERLRMLAGKGRMVERMTNAAMRWLQMKTGLSAFVMATIPNPVFDFTGIMAGVAHVSPARFLTGIFLGTAVQGTGAALFAYYVSQTSLLPW